MARIFFIHEWQGSTIRDWFPWLKKELEQRKHEVHCLEMPDPNFPKIEEWVPVLSRAVGKADENTFFVGHSIGCRTILNFIEHLPKNSKVGGAVFVGGWIHLKPEAYELAEDREIALPWLNTPIDFKKVKSFCKNFSAIFSDNDPFVDLKEAEIFKKELGSTIIIEHAKGHYYGEGIAEIPAVLQEVLKQIEKK